MRAARLLATTVGASAIDTEKLGCVRPGFKTYLTRGPRASIAVEMKMAPGTPVCALVRLAVSTTSSHASSSAKEMSGGIGNLYSAVVTPDPRGNASAPA